LRLGCTTRLLYMTSRKVERDISKATFNVLDSREFP
jgi:hypothetical protein